MQNQNNSVSILVLMDSFFLHLDDPQTTSAIQAVSILVLMDSFFLLRNGGIHDERAVFCLNPCFNGFFFLTMKTAIRMLNSFDESQSLF